MPVLLKTAFNPYKEMIRSNHTSLNLILLCALVLASCTSARQSKQVDENKIRQAAIMTNQCKLEFHDIPGSLTRRQECMNKASETLMADYPEAIQNIARDCARKLSLLAASTDVGNLSIADYQQHREALKTECADAAQAAKKS